MSLEPWEDTPSDYDERSDDFDEPCSLCGETFACRCDDVRDDLSESDWLARNPSTRGELPDAVIEADRLERRLDRLFERYGVEVVIEREALEAIGQTVFTGRRWRPRRGCCVRGRFRLPCACGDDIPF